MQHRHHPTRLFLAATLTSSVYLAACGGGGGDEASVEEGVAETQGSLNYTWSKVADERQTFSVTSLTRVRYGSGRSWVYKWVSGTASCTNEFFGKDPAPGVTKQCDARAAASAPPPLTGTASLSWSASPDASVSGYRVYYGKASGTYLQQRGQGQSVGNVTSFAVAGLESGQTYYFTVTAIDAEGSESQYSNEASKTTP